MPRALSWVLIATAACGSENKVEEDLDPNLTTQDDNNTTPGDDDDTAPGDDSPPDTDTTPGGGDDDDDNGSETGTPGTDTDLTEEEICEAAAALTITLDPYQTPDDGKVIYCHSSSGGSYNYIDSNISSCLPHLNHNYDVFPTSGCDT
jgi:hypothetical protein